MAFKNQADMPENCPPRDATANDLEPAYRIIENETVGEIDFKNHIERNLFYRKGQECVAIALSFYTTEEAAKDLRDNVKRFKNKLIAKGKITSDCGIHSIQHHHINLWVYEDIDMLKVFLGEEDK